MSPGNGTDGAGRGGHVEVLHILDDPALGGVTRLLASLLPSLADIGRHRRVTLPTRRRLAPPLYAGHAGGRPDVVVVHFTAAWSKLPFLASLRLLARDARIVLVEHSYTEAFERLCVPRPRRFRTMLRLAYALVDQVVAVSQGQARWMRAAGLVAAARLTVIPCVVDLAPFAAMPPPPRRQGPMNLGSFGRFAPQKGFDTLIAAMRGVPPEIATLEMAGYGPDEVALRRAAEGLAHVRIRGAVEPTEFLAGLDAVAMPSRWEAGAVTCWEVRAAGRPVIVSDVDGLPEQVPPEIGLVVPPDDPERLTEAIVRLARADRAAMAIAARRSTEGAYALALDAWRATLTGVARA